MDSYQNLLRQLGQSVPRGAFACRELDLTRAEDAECVAAQFGGADRMAERYPGLHALYKRSVKAGAPLRGADPRGFQDKAKVLDLGYDAASGAPYAVGTMTLTAPAQRLYLTLDIFADGKQAAHNAKFFSGKVSGEIEIQSEPMEPLPDGKMYTACLHATWEPEKSGVLRSQVASHEIAAGARDLVKSVLVTHPRHRYTPADGAITVTYARNDPQRDYEYSNTRDPQTGNEVVMLDMEGEIQLVDGFSVSDVSNGGAVLSCEGFGDILYLGSDKYGAEGEEGVVFFPGDGGKTIRWKLDPKWQNEIPDSVRFGNRLHDLEFAFSFRCNEEETPHEFLLTSKGTDLMLSQPHVEKISKIHLYWGCLAKGTKVALSDGTEKNIEELRPGDALLSPRGGSVVVRSLIPGTEGNIYRVHLANGMEVRATRTHPLGTPDGFVAPIDLKSGSRLATREGDLAVLYCYPETWNGPVYGVELESGDSFYADGVVSGTNRVMGALADSWADARETLEVDREVLEERDRLEADFQAGLL